MARALAGRRRTAEPEPGPEVVGTVGGKGRPTPRRRDAEAARRTRARVPRTRKEAQAAARDERRGQQALVREAMRTGDDRYLPLRDKGPVKRYVRDVVDSRRHVAEYFLPFVLVVTFLSIPVATSPALRFVPNIVLVVSILVAVVDGLVTSRSLRRGITERFGADQVRGNLWYGALRSTQFRRIRNPKPLVRPGDPV